MKKKVFSLFNLLMATLVTMLGFGACKTSKDKLWPAPSSPPNVEDIKEVYGPPPVYEQPDLPDATEEEPQTNETDSI